MRVTFINPNLGYFGVPNLGLAYVMAATAGRHTVNLIDLTFRGPHVGRHIRASVRAFAPEVIAISANSFTIQDSLRIARLLKASLGPVKIVLGGIHPTFFPDDTLRNRDIDAVCIGEGEESFVEYLACLEGARDPAVAGIWYKNAHGMVVRNGLRPFRSRLDEVCFPNWDSWDVEAYLASSSFFAGSLVHMASRGCPYDCTFCSSPVMRKSLPGVFFRQRSAENITAEIEENYKKYAGRGFKRIVFIDSVFGLDRKWLDEFCAAYARTQAHRALPWICQTRADIIDRDWCRQVRQAGCLLVDLGVESGNEAVRRKVYNKQVSDAQIFEAAALLKSSGILYRINMIVGCPQDTRETVRDTVRFREKIKPAGVRYTLYQPLPKTELGSVWSGKRFAQRRGIANRWDVPQLAVRGMSKSCLAVLMLKLRVLRYASSIKEYSARTRKSVLKELFAYLMACGTNKRRIPLFHPYAFSSWFDTIEQVNLLSRFEKAGTVCTDEDTLGRSSPAENHKR